MVVSVFNPGRSVKLEGTCGCVIVVQLTGGAGANRLWIHQYPL